jgi:hypothetical protein
MYSREIMEPCSIYKNRCLVTRMGFIHDQDMHLKLVLVCIEDRQIQQCIIISHWSYFRSLIPCAFWNMENLLLFRQTVIISVTSNTNKYK